MGFRKMSSRTSKVRDILNMLLISASLWQVPTVGRVAGLSGW